MTDTTVIAAPPVPAGPPPQLSPGGRNVVRVALVAAAAVLVLGSIAALGVAAWGLSSVRVVADQQNLPATMRTLTVDVGDIPAVVRITADRDTSEPQVRMRLVNAFQGAEPRLAVSDDDGGTVIRIDGETPPVQWSRGGEITVSLPPELARRLSVTTQQRSGPLITEAQVDRLVARTTHGPVLLSGGARRIDVHTVHGDVITRDPIAVTEHISATTSHGDVVMDFQDPAPRTVEASTRHGDIVIGLPGDGPYLVRAQAGESTKVRVPETSSAASAVGEVTASTDHGDVVVDKLRDRWG